MVVRLLLVLSSALSRAAVPEQVLAQDLARRPAHSRASRFRGRASASPPKRCFSSLCRSLFTSPAAALDRYSGISTFRKVEPSRSKDATTSSTKRRSPTEAQMSQQIYSGRHAMRVRAVSKSCGLGLARQELLAGSYRDVALAPAPSIWPAYRKSKTYIKD